MKKIEVTLEYLNFIIESVKELKPNVGTYDDWKTLDSMRSKTKYYLNKLEKEGE